MFYLLIKSEIIDTISFSYKIGPLGITYFFGLFFPFLDYLEKVVSIIFISDGFIPDEGTNPEVKDEWGLVQALNYVPPVSFAYGRGLLSFVIYEGLRPTFRASLKLLYSS